MFNVTAYHRRLLTIGSIFILSSWIITLLGFWIITDERFGPVLNSTIGTIVSWFAPIIFVLVFFGPMMTVILIISRWPGRYTWKNTLLRWPLAAGLVLVMWLISTLLMAGGPGEVFWGYVGQLLRSGGAYGPVFIGAALGLFIDWFFFVRHFKTDVLGKIEKWTLQDKKWTF